MRIHATLSGTRANGPGLRSAVWVQGCVGMGPGGIGPCPGCQNPRSHAVDVGEEIEPEELAERIAREATEGTVGLTISGGEPLQQAPAVYCLICMITAIRPSWDIGLFTGYTLTELTCGQYGSPDVHWHQKAILWDDIMQRLTFLISGRYDRTRTSRTDRKDLPWRHAVASANQNILLWKQRYTFKDFPSLMQEISIDETGLCQITGYAK